MEKHYQANRLKAHQGLNFYQDISLSELSIEFYKTYTAQAFLRSGIRLFEIDRETIEYFLIQQFQHLKVLLGLGNEKCAKTIYNNVINEDQDFYQKFHQYLESSNLLSKLKTIPKFLSGEGEGDTEKKLDEYIFEVNNDLPVVAKPVRQAIIEAPMLEQKIAVTIMTILKAAICIGLGISLAHIIGSTLICIGIALMAKKAYNALQGIISKTGSEKIEDNQDTQELRLGA